MSRLLTLFLIIALLTGCSQGKSALSESLNRAVKDKRISDRKMEIIMAEYAVLRDADKKQAKGYVEQIVNAIEMGADSTHIDVLRKQVVRAKATGPRPGG